MIVKNLIINVQIKYGKIRNVLGVYVWKIAKYVNALYFWGTRNSFNKSKI